MRFKFRTHVPALLALLALAACGGGGGGSDDAAPGAPAAPLAVNLPISGVAATGAALAAATVDVKCASGTAPATAITTGADGSYGVAVAGGTLPCVIRVTKDGVTLHSIVEQGASLPAVANVTPLTELLAALISGGAPSALYADFSTTAQARLTAANVTTASANLVSSLAGIVDLSGDDFLKGTLVAAVNGEGGNLLDQKLDAIQRALTETSTTLAELTTTVTLTPGTPPPVLADVPTAAASCPALRSGPYWVIEPGNTEIRVEEERRVEMDAARLTAIVQENGEPVTFFLQPVAGQPCRFTTSDDAQVIGTEEVLVSSSGFAASRLLEEGRVNSTIFFPATPVAVSELEGSWNYVAYLQELSGEFVSLNGRITFDATGVATNIQSFIGLDLDFGENKQLQYVQLLDGSFEEFINGERSGARLFAHRAPNGVITLVLDSPEPGLPGVVFLRRAETVAVRPVGSVTNFWNFQYQNSGVTEIADNSVTVTAFDASSTPKTETRVLATTGPSNGRVDTRSFNFPRTGLIYRPLNSCTNQSGAAVPCSSTITLPSQGTGYTIAAGLTANPANNFFDISVIKP